MHSKPLNLAAQQAQFTAYVRDPEHTDVPLSLQPRRMIMYAELIFNNVESFLSSNFPVIRKILTETQWLQLVRDFFIQHTSKTPYFVEIPEEFLSYLQDGRKNVDDYPFLLELAHYEWVEMALSVSQETLSINPPVTNLIDQPVQLSALAWPLAYQYPVQQISPDFLPLEAPNQPTFLLVYRNEVDEVKFMDINPVTYRLLQLIGEQAGKPVRDYLQAVSAELPHYDSVTVMAGGLQVLQTLAEKNVVTLG